MANLNKVFLIGNLTKDPELLYTSSGDACLNFVLATNRKYKTKDGETKEEATFIGCVAWKKTAELISQYLHKGDSLFVEGRLRQETFEDKDGKKQTKTKVTVENIQFMEKRKESEENNDTEG